MGISKCCVFFCIMLSISVVKDSFGMPRDSSVYTSSNIEGMHNDLVKSAQPTEDHIYVKVGSDVSHYELNDEEEHREETERHILLIQLHQTADGTGRAARATFDQRSLGASYSGRIHCQYQEPTEDEVCQEHCLPKGYSYGLCIGNTCSCV